MGMYTEIYVNVELREDTPPEVHEFLSVFGATTPPSDHPLFSTPRWDAIFHGGTRSYYFTRMGFYRYRAPDPVHAGLSLCADIKNYDSEIELFVDWITPYVAGNEYDRVHIGHTRYEEAIEPTLLYAEESSYYASTHARYISNRRARR